MQFAQGAHPGVLHNYAPRLVAFEYTPREKVTNTSCNFVFFLGGLGDSLMTVRYPSVLAALLPQSWGLAEIQLSSSGIGWTTGMLPRDSDELAKAVTYFRNVAKERNPIAPAKIVLLGHSTGCQIAMNYLVGPWKEYNIPKMVAERPKVDGVILQAGISDREGVEDHMTAQEIASSLSLAKSWIKEGRGGDQLPPASTKLLFGANPSAERWVSLIDQEGDDDYFRSDLPEDRLQRVWGDRGLATRAIKVMVLLGEKDEHMPTSIDKNRLIATWETQVKGSNGLWDDRSGVVKGVGHNLNRNDEIVVKGLCEKCIGFVESIDPDLAHKDTGKL